MYGPVTGSGSAGVQAQTLRSSTISTIGYFEHSFLDIRQGGSDPMAEQLDITTKNCTIEREGHTLIVTLNRPEAKNALSPAMLIGMYKAWRRLDEDDDLYCAVLTGKGDTFCAGHGPQGRGGRRRRRGRRRDSEDDAGDTRPALAGPASGQTVRTNRSSWRWRATLWQAAPRSSRARIFA